MARKFTLHQEDEITNFYQALRILASGSSVELGEAIHRYVNAANYTEVATLRRILEFMVENARKNE